jgi:Ca2+-binding RTX toxin-like protein
MGSDTLTGGDGDDTFVYTDNLQLRADNSVSGGNGTDRIKFTIAIDTLTSGSPQGDNFHADFSRVSGVEQIELYGASKVNLGDVFPSAGVKAVIIGNDDTTLRYDNSVLGNISVDATALADNKTLTLTGAADASVTGAFVVTNLKGDLFANDMSGNISVTASAGSNFSVTLNAGSGNDTINGGASADIISGGAGSDVIDGGLGDDTYIYAGAGDSTINNAALASGFDTVKITSGDVFDFARDVTAVLADEYYVGQVPQANGDNLLNQLNSYYQLAGPSAGIDAMYISIGNNSKGRFLVIDIDDNDLISEGDLIIEIVGVTNNKNIQLSLSNGNVVMMEVDPPFGP